MGRGLGAETVGTAMLGVVGEGCLPEHERFLGMLCIPYFDKFERVIGVRFRRLDNGKPKYNQPSGRPTLLYRPWSVENQTVAHVTEGELDALSLVEAGFSGVVGVPGATNWKDWYPVLFEPVDTVFVWGDGDEAGSLFAGRVVESLPGKARVVGVPSGMDVNALLVDRGVEGLKELAF